MKGINIFLADGFEDIEALATCDVLRRGECRVNLIAVGEDPFVTSSHGVTLGMDNFLEDLPSNHNGTNAKDFMIFPGGMPGSKTLAANRTLISLMRDHYKAGGSLAAICAAPGLVLSKLDTEFDELVFTCFDGFEQSLVDKGALFVRKGAVASGRIITGRSAGYATGFGLEILRAIKGEEVAEKVRKAMFLDVD